MRCKRILGPAGVPQTHTSKEPFNKTYTTIVCTSLAGEYHIPLRLTLKEGTNSQLDFLRFIIYLFRINYLKPGDVLILDNAKIHASEAAILVLLHLCKHRQVFVRFMPFCSPEVSPAELVHGFVKGKVSTDRGQLRLWQAIVAGHAAVTPQMMLNFYKKCVQYIVVCVVSVTMMFILFICFYLYL